MLDWVMIVAAMLGLGGIYLFWRGLFRDRSKGRSRCPKCWYEMTELDSLQCPECGRTVSSASKLLKTRRRWGLVSLGVFLLLLGIGVGTTTNAMLHGWQAAPRPVLVGSLFLVEDSSDERAALVAERLEGMTVPERHVVTRFCIRMMKGGARPDIMWATGVLERVGRSGRAAIPVCRDLVDNGVDMNLRQAAARALCAIGDVESIEKVIELFDEDGRILQWLEVVALTRSDEALEVFEGVLEDYPEFDHVLQAVARAIGLNGVEEGLEILRRLVDREDYELNQIIVGAMTEIDESHPTTREALMAMMESGHRRIALLAYEHLDDAEREEAKRRIRSNVDEGADVFIANQLYVLHHVYEDRSFIEPFADPQEPRLTELSEEERSFIVESAAYMLANPPPVTDESG